MAIDYDGRVFKSISNSTGGDVGSGTLFHYRQAGDLVWGTYQGGEVRLGTLIACVLPDESLDVRYQHITTDGCFKTGCCISIPSLNADGRIRLTESWKWKEGGVGTGQSVVEEVPINNKYLSEP